VAAIRRKQNPGMGGTMSDGRNNPGWDRWIAYVDACALAALRVVRELEATGIRSHRALARELNNRGVPTVMRRKWYARTVHNLLAREAKISNQKQPVKQRKHHER
jgi:hypothetical protein